jgi:GT2 family glycosyltransferase
MPVPRVGVAVLNYERAADTIDCLASLRRLSTPVDVVVVDNGSSDDSVERIKAAAPGVDVIEAGENLGFGRGNNLAIERFMSGPYDFVWLLNNDATADTGALAAMLAEAQRDAKVGAVGSVIYHADQRDAVQTWGGGSVSMRTGRSLDATAPGDRVDYITAASALLRVAALREVGTFDPDFFFLYEDTDLGVRLRARGWRVAVAAASRVWHRGGGTVAAVSPQRAELHAAGWVQFLRKHTSVAWARSLVVLVYYCWMSVSQRRFAIAGAAWRGWRRGWRR